MNNKYFKPLVLVVSLIIICITTLVSYAYFTASVNGNGSVNNNAIATGHMEVTYNNGSELSLKENMIPGDYIIKTFRSY